jgi:hypothetical protein
MPAYLSLPYLELVLIRTIARPNTRKIMPVYKFIFDERLAEIKYPPSSIMATIVKKSPITKLSSLNRLNIKNIFRRR